MSSASRIEKFWYSKSHLKWLLWPISKLLFALTFLKYFFYKHHWLEVVDANVPVLVVGNITVGGTGKTPFIILLAELLQRSGFKVGIVSRGYRSFANEYPHMVNSHDSVKTAGDEAFMLFQRLQLPLVIDANRSRAVEKLSKSYDLDLIISDDGLQHYRMARICELILIDSSRELGNRLCLPFGPLRESEARLNNVDLIVQNGGDRLSSLIKKSDSPAIIMSIKNLALVHIQSNNNVALANLKNQDVYAVCGIGNPQRFFDSLSLLCQSYTRVIFSDHHQFIAEDFADFDKRPVVMTEKDAVKCREFAQPNWYYLKVGASISDEASEKLLNIITDKLNGK